MKYSLLLVFLFAGRILGGEAIFSPAGDAVFLADFEAAKVTRVELKSKELTSLDFTADIKAPIESVAAVPDKLVIVTQQSIWKTDFDGSKLRTFAALPEGSHFLDAAWNPADKRLYATISEGENLKLVRYEGDGKSRPVRCRRAVPHSGYSFTAKGELLFATNGDMWIGSIQEEEDQLDLTAYRFAPVATLETYPGTPAQVGASLIVPGMNKIYTHVRRMGGSGWGWVVRLNPPPGMEEFEADREENELLWRAKVSISGLQSMEILASNGTYSHLCASPDGKFVFFRGNDDKSETSGYYLIEEDGAPKPLELQIP